MNRPKPPFNVILISFDTLRRDHVHAYGYPKPLSPTLDRLAGQGVKFGDVFANSGWTLPQHMTFITGMHPLKHRLVYLTRRRALSTRFRTLAQILEKHGYVTMGFSSRSRLGGGWEFGFARGMQSYMWLFPNNNMMEALAEPMADCLRLVGSNPFFIYIQESPTLGTVCHAERLALPALSEVEGSVVEGIGVGMDGAVDHARLTAGQANHGRLASSVPPQPSHSMLDENHLSPKTPLLRNFLSLPMSIMNGEAGDGGIRPAKEGCRGAIHRARKGSAPSLTAIHRTIGQRRRSKCRR